MLRNRNYLRCGEFAVKFCHAIYVMSSIRMVHFVIRCVESEAEEEEDERRIA